MRITKFTHACVRIEHGGSSVVLDPGGFTTPESVEGADAVLITHEHFDHYDPANLRACDATIHTIADVAAKIAEDAPDLAERVVVVAPDDTFDLGGIAVRVVGEDHAVIHADIPRIHNSGFVLTMDDTSVYHPGDALTVPGEAVDLLLTPASAPWMRMAEAIDFVREVGAPHNLAIHDAIYSDAGLGVVDSFMDNLNGPRGLGWTRLQPGQELPPL